MPKGAKHTSEGEVPVMGERKLILPDVPDYTGKTVEDVENEFPKGTRVKFVKGSHRGTVGVIADVFGGGKSGNIPHLLVTLTHYKRNLDPRHKNVYVDVTAKPAFVEALTPEEEELLFDDNGDPQ